MNFYKEKRNIRLIGSRLKRNLKKYVQKYPNIYYLIYIIGNINNKQFKAKVLNINDGYNTLEFYSYGNKNVNTVIYYIRIRDLYKGFFAIFFDVLYGIQEARRWGFKPVVDWENTIYQENDEIHGTKNSFEYYFEQVSNISCKDVLSSSRVAIFNRNHLKYVQSGIGSYGNTEDDLKKSGTIIKKYIKLNKYSNEYIKNGLKNITQEIRCVNFDEIIGIHIRGTDFKLHWDRHPNAVCIDNYFPLIDEAMKNERFKYIFLATDDIDYLNKFIAKYSDKVIYYTDIKRGNGLLNIAKEKNIRNCDHYLSGLEVLRDVYTLSICGGLIAGISNVSMAARAFKYSRDEEYSFVKIIDKGIYEI